MTFTDQIARHSATRRRALALLLAVCLIAAIWNFVLVPIAWITASQDVWRTEIRAQLARAKGRAAAEGDVKAQLVALPAAPIWGRFYRAAENGDARTLIQRDLTALCGTAGAIVQSIVPLSAMEERGLTRHGVRITATVTADQMKALAGGIRNHAQYLRVEHLSISAPQIQSADQNPQLTITLEVFGYSYSTGKREKA